MMISRSFAILVSALALLFNSWSASAADSPVVGTWQVTTYSMTVVSTNQTSRPFGENPKGYIQYSPGGHMVVFLQTGNQIRIAGSAYTDAERAEVHKSIFGAYAGTYTVEGDKIVNRVVAAWRPDWIGTDQIRFFEISGNKLTITTAPVTFSQTGQQIVSTLTFERVE
jgi:hypothetical protein